LPGSVSYLEPNERDTVSVRWNFTDGFNFKQYGWLYYNNGGDQVTDLIIPNATLKTIVLNYPYGGGSSSIVKKSSTAIPTPTPTPTPIPIDYGGGNINSGEIVESSIDFNGDVDEWEFTAYAPSKVTIAMNLINPNDNLNPYLELISPFGTIATSNDDGGGSKNALISEFELTVSGKYIIRAQGSSLKTTGSYLILLNIN